MLDDVSDKIGFLVNVMTTTVQSFTGHWKRKFEIKKEQKNLIFQYSENIFHEKKFNSICKMDNQIKDDGVICILYKLHFWDLIDLDPFYIGSPGLSFPHVSKYFALNQEWANIFSAGLTNILFYHLGICFWFWLYPNEIDLCGLKMSFCQFCHLPRNQ